MFFKLYEMNLKSKSYFNYVYLPLILCEIYFKCLQPYLRFDLKVDSTYLLVS